MHDHGALTRKAAIASVATAAFLILLKAYAAAQTGSVAMLGSLADTGLDLIASLVTLIAVSYAAQPADEQHRFGHGKAEAISALFQVMLIVVSALLIGWRAIIRLLEGATTAAPEYGISVSVIAMLATLALLAYQRRIIRQTGSVAIHADHVHYQSDLLLNAAVIAALILDNMLQLPGVDPLFGMAIALWLLWGAGKAGKIAFDQLMDREWPLEKRTHVLEMAKSHPEVRDIHAMRTRSSGTHDFCQFHIALDPQMTITDAHKVMEEVEAQLIAAYPGLELLIHPDPEGHSDPLSYEPEEMRKTIIK